MNISSQKQGADLYIHLSGELDEYNASLVRDKVDALIDANISSERVIVNLAGVKFMDSTGIGFLIGRYKKLKRCSTPMYIQEPNLNADKILNISGIYSLIPKL